MIEWSKRWDLQTYLVALYGVEEGTKKYKKMIKKEAK